MISDYGFNDRTIRKEKRTVEFADTKSEAKDTNDS
jgi:hypothetical protein